MVLPGQCSTPLMSPPNHRLPLNRFCWLRLRFHKFKFSRHHRLPLKVNRLRLLGFHRRFWFWLMLMRRLWFRPTLRSRLRFHRFHRRFRFHRLHRKFRFHRPHRRFRFWLMQMRRLWFWPILRSRLRLHRLPSSSRFYNPSLRFLSPKGGGDPTGKTPGNPVPGILAQQVPSM